MAECKWYVVGEPDDGQLVAPITLLPAGSMILSPEQVEQIKESVGEEIAALRILSYHGCPSSEDGRPWMADLTDADVEKIIALLASVLSILDADRITAEAANATEGSDRG